MTKLRIFFFGMTLLLFCACQKNKWEKITQLPEVIPPTSFVVPQGLPTANSWESYVPDTMHLDHLPQRRLRINFHFMNSVDRSQNYDRKMSIDYSYYLTKGANKKLNNNKKAWLPLRNDIPALPTRYHYVITGSDKGHKSDKGTYLHYDDELYYFVKSGKNRNSGDRTVLKKYGVGLDSIINVFMMPHHPDSIASKSYRNDLTGIALGMHTKIALSSKTKVDAYRNTSNFNHELGHIFGLPHSWGNDGCDDTPRHNNKCWNYTKNGSVCDSMVTNNLMSYNIAQSSITPCQIGKVQKNLAKYNSKLRNYQYKDWCTYDQEPIEIRKTFYWTGEKDLSKDIYIKNGGTLYISSRISMAPNSKIVVEKGGRLVLDKARLHNDCGKKWQGILRDAKGGAEVIFLNAPKLENIAFDLVER